VLAVEEASPEKESPMALVTVEDLVKHYGDVHAVDGVTFDIEDGEVFGLLGPNGAGKSTIINVLATYVLPTRGRAIVAGHDVTREPEAVKRLIGWVPQEIALYPELSAIENLSFYGRMSDVPEPELQPAIAETLELVGLTRHAQRPVSQYSGGMKRRANLAAGLLSKPRLLMLDEPTVGVDPQSRNALSLSLQALKQKGMSILYTTHYMKEAELLCDRVAILDEGRIIALDTPQNLINTLGTGLIHIGVKDVDEDRLSRMRALPLVRSVIQRDGTLILETVHAQQALLSVIGLFNETDTDMTMLEILEPNLETVFIQLTGKQLRD
jgi:ABC-2 type transport system ATP-binding protein